MVDYVRLAATATRLIKKNGREVKFIAFNDTPQVAGQPWLGPVNPRTSPDAQLTLFAAFVEPSSAVALGISSETSDLVKRSEKIMIVSPGSSDLALFQEVQDEGTTWKITDIEVLRPATTTVLAFVGLER